MIRAEETFLPVKVVEAELRNYDNLRLQAKTVIADLMARLWEHFVNHAVWVVGSYKEPTAAYFRQYMLDWFDLDIRA